MIAAGGKGRAKLKAKRPITEGGNPRNPREKRRGAQTRIRQGGNEWI